MGDRRIQDFYRLFMVPGMAHCSGGPGTDIFGQIFSPPSAVDDAQHSMTRALESWVEKGIAPETIIAAKYNNNNPDEGVTMTRPLCPYPQIAVYKGSGSTKEAVNFHCVKGNHS